MDNTYIYIYSYTYIYIYISSAAPPWRPSRRAARFARHCSYWLTIDCNYRVVRVILAQGPC